jgi:hypothetical protein
MVERLVVRRTANGVNGATPVRELARAHRNSAALLLATAAWAVAAVAAQPAHAGTQAQTPAQTARPGVLAGRVLDAHTAQPLAHAVVTLEPLSPVLLVDAAGALVAARTLITGASGAYGFGDVAPGAYRLRIERLGYRALAIEIDVHLPADARVSVALELEPIALEPMRVEQRAPTRRAHGPGAAGTDAAVRIAAERARQELFLTPDARVLTYDDVVSGVTLGEGDVFRALQRFPGVGTRDDYTAELWTRGAPWTQTRVTFDGVPLYNPLHALGVLSALSPEVLGAVHFHPGVRPVALGGGAAAVIDLRTRPGGGNGEVRGAIDASMASAKLALDQRPSQRLAWVLTLRRSHVDVLSGGLGWLGLDSVDLPYVFRDVAGRLDVVLGPTARIEASALWEDDRLHGDVPGVLELTTADWGNAAGRTTLIGAIGGVEARQSIGASRFAANTAARTLQTRSATPPWTEPESRNRITHIQLAGSLQPARGGSSPRWSFGYEVVRSAVDYEGPFPRYYAVKPDTVARLHYARTLDVGALYGDARVSFGDRLMVSPGLRIELGGAIAGAAAVRPSPRVAARYALSSEQSVSAAVGRSWQYTQAIGLAGPSVHPAFHASHFWLWADPATPAIRADVASIGTERWLADGMLVGVTGFVRRANGVTTPDPAPGPLQRRPLFVVGAQHARGVELGARRIAARWSASLSYAYSRAQLEIDGATHASPADRRHVLDVLAGVRLPAGLRLLGAYAAMSAAPFTRAYSRAPVDCTSFGFGCDDPTGSYVELHNAERTPDYRSLDVSLQWARAVGRVELGAYAQVRNVAGRDNASTYSGSVPIGRITDRDGTRIIWEDRFERGLPRLPLLGVRLAF